MMSLDHGGIEFVQKIGADFSIRDIVLEDMKRDN